MGTEVTFILSQPFPPPRRPHTTFSRPLLELLLSLKVFPVYLVLSFGELGEGILWSSPSPAPYAIPLSDNSSHVCPESPSLISGALYQTL